MSGKNCSIDNKKQEKPWKHFMRPWKRFIQAANGELGTLEDELVRDLFKSNAIHIKDEEYGITRYTNF